MFRALASRQMTATAPTSINSRIQNTPTVRYAGTTSAGQTKNRPDNRKPKSWGLKRSMFQKIKTGEILATQKGNRYWPGEGTRQARDFGIFASKPGYLYVVQRKIEGWSNGNPYAKGFKKRTYLCVRDELPKYPKDDIR
mmetsp:Transcript_14710/g.16332  ORF Transcript_14710/g.16332 Transcript_14710/m.16332 type:complete len:139 (-) Transcript_14710:146-562(-)